MRFSPIFLLIAFCAVARADTVTGLNLADAALAQVGVTTTYDPSYVKLRYPGGDLPKSRGVCSDVVIRAFRAIGVDLQQAVHEDMKNHFDAYPKIWGLRATDTNIDHRRVPNLMRFFDRRGKSKSIGAGYEPGDVVAWRLPNGLYHIGIVTGTGVVHNIGYGAQNEDVLRAFRIIGHYRW
ncbi:MAG TPA: DUF1287 domain-containing protein [Thermoanaerobaculia bacterium]